MWAAQSRLRSARPGSAPALAASSLAASSLAASSLAASPLSRSSLSARGSGQWFAALSMLALGVLMLAGACAPLPRAVDPTQAAPPGELGRPVLGLHWTFELDDRASEVHPQEFASPAVVAGRSGRDTQIYVGSADGWFYAIDGDGEVIWKKRLGAVSARPTLAGGWLYVGTDDGFLIALGLDGEERWRYASRGPLLQSPVVVGELLIFTNEADQVFALDRASGEFRWQYKADTPEEYTLRGHAGIAVAGELVITGFANGTLVGLRASSGQVAWLTSLKGEAERFTDVDATPVVLGDKVYAASSSGGLYAADANSGLIEWRLPSEGGGALATDGELLFFAAAENGIYAVDLSGHIRWRQGTRGGGEPADLAVEGDYLLATLSAAGLYVADRKTGHVLQFFDPGYGISAAPTAAGGRLFVVSNSSILYAFVLRDFEIATAALR